MPSPTKLAPWTIAISAVAIFMVSLDNLVVTNALASIREDLGASIEALEWTVNAYTLAFAVFLLTGAALGDRFGRRRVFVAGLGIFTVASAAAALAPSTGALIAARALQGAGAAIIAPLSLTLLSADDPGGEARPRARHLVRRQRPRRRARPARRRRRHRGHLVAVDLLAQRPRRARRSPRSRCAGSTRATGRPRAWTCPAWRSPAPACSAWSTASSAATPPAGARPRWSARSPSARSSSSRSSPTSCAPPPRCCRCASSARAPSRPPTACRWR